jgi:hypothetical protein
MGVVNVPTAAGGGIKSVQRGQAVSAGSVTITAVNTAKSFVMSFSEGAAGTVASNSTETGSLTPTGGDTSGSGSQSQQFNNTWNAGGSSASYSGTRTVSGGTMDATTANMGAYLSNSTTLVVTGACRWEVVEFA